MVLDLAPLRRHGHLQGKEEGLIPTPSLLYSPPQNPAIPGTPGRGQTRRSEPGAGLTDLSPFFPLPITVL